MWKPVSTRTHVSLLFYSNEFPKEEEEEEEEKSLNKN